MFWQKKPVEKESNIGITPQKKGITIGFDYQFEGEHSQFYKKLGMLPLDTPYLRRHVPFIGDLELDNLNIIKLMDLSKLYPMFVQPSNCLSV